MDTRRALPADAAAIRELTRLAYAKWVSLIGREPRPMFADYDKAVVEHVIDLYEDDGQLRALIEMAPSADHLLIVNLAVHPDCQKQGLGDALLAQAERHTRSIGLSELRLYTNAAFTSNIGFYAQRGFVETHREALPGGGELVHMHKRI